MYLKITSTTMIRTNSILIHAYSSIMTSTALSNKNFKNYDFHFFMLYVDNYMVDSN